MNPGQKQMQEQWHRNMEAAWHVKKEEEKRAADGRRNVRPGLPDVAASSHFEVDERFRQVEAEVARLSQELSASHLSKEEFEQKAKELMLQDDQGKWWMVGTNTGTWFRFEGQEWVQSSPPGRWVEEPHVTAGRHRLRAVILFLVLFSVVLAVGFACGSFMASLRFRGGEPLVVASLVWLFGLIWVCRRARRTWRGR